VGTSVSSFKRTVLAIGIDPEFVDVKEIPGLTPQLVRNFIDTQLRNLSDSGYDVVNCLVDLGATAARVVESALRTRGFDCVMIGAGLRQPSRNLLLFEEILNLVHALAPGARICFNTTPADTTEAVKRWVTPH
jgi:hypothetical protein